ncbi:MAG: rhamnogalacturonan acetylesterase [Odoribacter sp.]|nr:rhamnogalacturonan acetylesterase [Odoribacter sp.]
MKIRYTLLMIGLALLMISWSSDRTPVIHMIGDSTMANKDTTKGNTERGWGHVLSEFLTGGVEVKNYAVNGRSTRNFKNKDWDRVYNNIKEGDYVFIQFGHNDQKHKDSSRFTQPYGEYKENLKMYINQTREKGGTPILFTSIARRNFVDGELVDTHGDYITAVHQVADETGVTLIDLNKASIKLLEEDGDELSKRWFVWVEPGVVEKYPNGQKDNTHLNVAGARKMASLAIIEIKEKEPALGKYFVEIKE